MTTRLSITIPDDQAEFLKAHKELRASGLLQQKISELMRKGKEVKP